jgi:hypothetical protein
MNYAAKQRLLRRQRRLVHEWREAEARLEARIEALTAAVARFEHKLRELRMVSIEQQLDDFAARFGLIWKSDPFACHDQA